MTVWQNTSQTKVFSCSTELAVSLSLFEIQNRVAVVTGASSGIGLTISEVLASAGAKVVLLARREEHLERAVDSINMKGGSAHYVTADLCERKQIEQSSEQICKFFGNPEIVVNAAGINLRQSTDDVTWESWDTTIHLNLSVPFFFSRMFVSPMIERGWGKIINVASLQSLRAFKNGIAYGASKGGVAQLTRAMAEAWSRHGISCNAIAPGFFETALTAAVFADSASANKIAEATAIGRNGEMEDLHGPILFLASAASDYVTGQILYVDGGFSAK